MLQVTTTNTTLQEQDMPAVDTVPFPNIFKTPDLVTLSDDESSVISEVSSSISNGNESGIETSPKSLRQALVSQIVCLLLF